MKTLRDYIDLVDQKFNQALSEKVTLPADGSSPQTQTVNGVTMNAPANAVQTGSGGVLKTGTGAAVTSGTPAPAPDATAAAKAKLTPSQLKWLGGADATDSAIMARMPKPLPGEVVPGAAPAQAAQAAPAAAPAAPDTAGAYDDEGNMMPGWSTDENGNPVKVADQDGKTFVEPATQALADKGRQDAAVKTQAANGVNAAGQNVTMANGINPETGEPTTPAAPAQAAQAAPVAKPKVMAKPDPAVMKIQQDLIAKGAKIKADGVMGPATQAAQKQFGANQTAATAARTGVAMNNTAGAGRGTVVPPVAKESRAARVDHAFIDELNAMRSIAGLPTKNKW